MISVLIVDDCEADCERLRGILEAAPDVHVVAAANCGTDAIDLAAEHEPDVIAMDWQMPAMDGLKTTERIMEVSPRPVVLLSEGWRSGDSGEVSRVYECGAVAGARKPTDPELSGYGSICEELLQTVRRSAAVKVVRRWARNGQGRPSNGSDRPVAKRQSSGTRRVVAIGVSTGGPPVLEAILSRLPARFPAPILVVQHIADGFVSGLIDWLRRVTPLEVHLAEAGETAFGGHVYVSPSDRHLGIDRRGRIVLDDGPLERSQRPAVSYLFRSVAHAFAGDSVAVLLTGMGSDGAVELKHLADLHAVTVAQDQESCTVFGMPAEAIKIGAAQHILPPPEIGDLLCRLFGVAGSPDGSVVTSGEEPVR